MGPLLDAIRQLGESAHRLEAEEAVVKLMSIPAEELEERYEKTGARIVQRNIEWAASALRFFGLIGGEDRGVWTLTEKGRHQNLTTEEGNELAREWNAHRRAVSLQGRSGGPQPTALPEVDEDVEELPAVSSLTLLQVLKGLSPGGFERLSQLLLRQAGFSKVIVTGKSSDGGIDGHGVLEINELVSFPLKVRMFMMRRTATMFGRESHFG